MTLIAKIAGVFVPRTFAFEATYIPGMNHRIGSQHAIEIPMTARPCTRRVTGVVTRFAVFRVTFCGAAVIRQPAHAGVVQRYPVEPVMAIAAEQARIMTAVTLGVLAARIQTVGEGVIQVVNPALEIVSPVTIEAHVSIAVTTGAGWIIWRNHIAMDMSPIVGMDLVGRNTLLVTHGTFNRGGQSIVAVHARGHSGEMSRRALRENIRVAAGAESAPVQMLLVGKGYGTFGVRRGFEIFRIAVTGAAHFIVFHIMAVGTHVHGGKVAIGRLGAGCHTLMTCDALQLLFCHMEIVGEEESALFLDPGYRFPLGEHRHCGNRGQRDYQRDANVHHAPPLPEGFHRKP
jgi:hypothetical protein